jgi:hypothetical protein
VRRPRARYSYALQRPDYGITNYFFTQRLDPPPRAALDLPPADLEARAPALHPSGPHRGPYGGLLPLHVLVRSAVALQLPCSLLEVDEGHASCAPARLPSLLREAQACSSVLPHASLPRAPCPPSIMASAGAQMHFDDASDTHFEPQDAAEAQASGPHASP